MLNHLLLTLLLLCPTKIHSANDLNQDNFIDINDFPNEEFMQHFYGLCEFVKDINNCHIDGLDSKIEYILDINYQQPNIFIYLMDLIFSSERSHIVLTSIDPNKTYQLIQSRKKDNNDIEWITSKKHMTIRDWALSDLHIIIGANASFYPLPTGRYLFKFWCMLSLIEHFHIQYMKSFFLSKIKQKKDYFSSKKDEFKKTINEIRKIKPNKLKEVYKEDFDIFLSIREGIFNILKEKFFNIYYDNMDQGLLALIEFVKIDFDPRGIYDPVRRDKKSLCDDILFLKLQNSLYGLFVNNLQEQILNFPRVSCIKDIVISRTVDGNYHKYLLTYDPELYNDYDFIYQHHKNQQNILQELINNDEEKNQYKPIKKVTKPKKRPPRKTVNKKIPPKINPIPKAKRQPRAIKQKQYNQAIMLKDLDSYELKPSSTHKQILRGKNDFLKENSKSLAGLRTTFISKIDQESFDNKKNYSAILANYSNQYLSLLKNIIRDFAQSSPLANGKSIEQSMSFLVLGSLAHGLAVPSSDLEMIVLIDEWQPEYFVWLSKLFKVLKEIGFKLDYENLHPPIFSTKKEKIQEGNFFTVITPSTLASYYDFFTINESNLIGIISDIPAELKTFYEKNIEPRSQKIGINNLPYWHDPSAQMIDNIRKNLITNKYIYGCKNLGLLFDELMQDKKELYMRLLDNIAVKYDKFYSKNHLNSQNEEESIKYYAQYYEQNRSLYPDYTNLYDFVAYKIKNIFYRPVQLAISNYFLLKMRYPEINQNKFKNVIKEAKRYISFLRMRIEALETSKEQLNDVDAILKNLGFEQSYFDEKIKPLYEAINSLLLLRELSPLLMAD